LVAHATGPPLRWPRSAPPRPADGGRASLVNHVRSANERFKDVGVAVLEGYEPIACASGVDGGAMGVHYVNATLIGETVDIKKPQAVMYEATPDGAMQLNRGRIHHHQGAGVAGQPAVQLQQRANRYGLPPFYELHVWAWKMNPRGAFADMNPTVTCEHHAAK